MSHAGSQRADACQPVAAPDLLLQLADGGGVLHHQQDARGDAALSAEHSCREPHGPLVERLRPQHQVLVAHVTAGSETGTQLLPDRLGKNLCGRPADDRVGTGDLQKALGFAVADRDAPRRVCGDNAGHEVVEQDLVIDSRVLKARVKRGVLDRNAQLVSEERQRLLLVPPENAPVLATAEQQEAG